LVIKIFWNIFAVPISKAAMKKEYIQPASRVVGFSLETTFCLSNADGTGGNLSGYGEDDENIF
jgi:hypothetical protein